MFYVRAALLSFFSGDIFSVYGKKVFIDRKRQRDLQMGLGKSNVIETVASLAHEGTLGIRSPHPCALVAYLMYS